MKEGNKIPFVKGEDIFSGSMMLMNDINNNILNDSARLSIVYQEKYEQVGSFINVYFGLEPETNPQQLWCTLLMKKQHTRKLARNFLKVGWVSLDYQRKYIKY